MRPTARTLPVVLLLVLAALAGCGGDPERPRAFSPLPSGGTSGAAGPTPPGEAAPSTRGPARSVPDGVLGEALRHVPDEAAVATVTDFDRVRARLGVPDLTSADLMTDRFRFWEQAPGVAVLLHEGRLRDQNSLFELDYGFTQDDVDWELGFTGNNTSGFVLGFRPDLDMGPVRTAVADGAGPLAGATVLAEEHLLVSGDAAPTAAQSWAGEPWAAAAGAQPADSYYLRSGRGACIPLEDTLGGEATVEDQERVLDRADVRSLDRIDAVALAFTGPATALALLSYAAPPAQDEVNRRAALGDAWPGSDDSAAYADGFTSATALPVTGDPVGVIRLGVRNPRAAAAVAFGDLLPFAVCGDVRLLPEPTGL